MQEKNKFHYGLLYMIHLIIDADGVIDEHELKALEMIIEVEKMDDGIYKQFINEIGNVSERQIYENGIGLISTCTKEEQLRAFSWLMKISESDGHVHAKEIRFLLYSVKKAGIEFNDVLNGAKSLPKLP